MKKRHHWVVRLTHWVNVVALAVMVGSGLRIFNAYPRFARRGESFCCWPWEGTRAPGWLTFGGWLGGARNWHFFAMWILVLNGLLYLGFLYLHGEWRDLAPRRGDTRRAWDMVRFYLFLEREHPRQGKHNTLQKLAYFSMPWIAAVIVVTGVAIWKPVSLAPLADLLGGYALARYWHFMAMLTLVFVAAGHVFMVFAVDPYSLRSMITGGYSEALSPEARNARPFLNLLPRRSSAGHPEPSHEAHRPAHIPVPGSELAVGGAAGGVRVPGPPGGEAPAALDGAAERGAGASALPTHRDGHAGQPPARGGGAPELLHQPPGAGVGRGGAGAMDAGGDRGGEPAAPADPAAADVAAADQPAGGPLLRGGMDGDHVVDGRPPERAGEDGGAEA